MAIPHTYDYSTHDFCMCGYSTCGNYARGSQIINYMSGYYECTLNKYLCTSWPHTIDIRFQLTKYNCERITCSECINSHTNY